MGPELAFQQGTHSLLQRGQFCSLQVHYCCNHTFIITLILKTSLKVKKEGWLAIIASGLLLALYSFMFFQGLKKGAAGAGGVFGDNP
jgi:hypothetical protein